MQAGCPIDRTHDAQRCAGDVGRELGNVMSARHHECGHAGADRGLAGVEAALVDGDFLQDLRGFNESSGIAGG